MTAGFDPTSLIIGTGISILGSMFGGSKAANAAREQSRLANEAAQRRLIYDEEMWDMKRSQLYSDRVEEHSGKML